MNIAEIKPEFVFATIQKLGDGEILYCADFWRGELIDSYGMTVGQTSRKIQSNNCKFFKVTKE